MRIPAICPSPWSSSSLSLSLFFFLIVAFPSLCASGRGFRCRNGLHVSMGHVCDKVDSCGDNSDENPYLCEHICTFMGRKRFECWETAYIHGCVFGMELYQWCDGINQCISTRDLTRVAEDEKYCDYEGPYGDQTPILRENKRNRYVPEVGGGDDDNYSNGNKNPKISEEDKKKDEDFRDFKDSIALLGGILGIIFFSVVGVTVLICCICICRKCHQWRKRRRGGGGGGHGKKSATPGGGGVGSHHVNHHAGIEIRGGNSGVRNPASLTQLGGGDHGGGIGGHHQGGGSGGSGSLGPAPSSFGGSQVCIGPPGVSGNPVTQSFQQQHQAGITPQHHQQQQLVGVAPQQQQHQQHHQSGGSGGSRAQTPRCTTPASIHSSSLIFRPETPDAGGGGVGAPLPPSSTAATTSAGHHHNPMAHRPLPPPPSANPLPQYTPGTYPGCASEEVPSSCPPSYNGSVAGDNYCPPTYNDVVNPPFNPGYR